MAYDATELTKALEAPALTVERSRWWHYVFGVRRLKGATKTYRGRILSHREWLPLQRRWLEVAELESGTAEDRAKLDQISERLIRDTCRAVGIPAKVVMNLPGRAMQEALNDFLACQFRAHTPGGGTMPNRKIRRSRPVSGSPNGSARKMRPAARG